MKENRHVFVIGLMIVISLFDSCDGFILMNNAELCAYLADVNCPVYYGEHLCGTDHVTYENECEFARTVCNDDTLGLLHEGPCEHEKMEQEAVLNVTCADIMNMNCAKFQGTAEICASDGQTYSNECYFEKARCASYDLFLKHYDACDTSQVAK